jgi:hypothetical protein
MWQGFGVRFWWGVLPATSATVQLTFPWLSVLLLLGGLADWALPCCTANVLLDVQMLA